MKHPNIQQRYIKRCALAVTLAQRLTDSSMIQYRTPEEFGIEHRFYGWISGGFKEYWPSAIKNRLRRLNRRANFYFDRAIYFRPRYQRMTKLRALVDAAVTCATCGTCFE